MKLNLREDTSYNRNFVNKISTMKPGTYFIRDFFGSEASVPRIARKFYNEVKSGKFYNVRLAKSCSREGYEIT